MLLLVFKFKHNLKNFYFQVKITYNKKTSCCDFSQNKNFDSIAITNIKPTAFFNQL